MAKKKYFFFWVKKLNYVKWVELMSQWFETFILFVNIATTRLNRPRGGFSENFHADLFIKRLCKTKG